MGTPAYVHASIGPGAAGQRRPGAPQNVAINANTIFTMPTSLAGNALEERVLYKLKIVGGEGICYRVTTAAGTCATTDDVLWNGDEVPVYVFTPNNAVLELRKRVAGTLDATAILVRMDGVAA